MLLDQITSKALVIPTDRKISIRVIDITLKKNDKGKLTPTIVLEKEKIREDCLAIRLDVDAANDTIKWNRAEEEPEKEPKPFLGIPIQNNQTQVTTLIKMVRVIYRTDLKNKIENQDPQDKQERTANAEELTDSKSIPYELKDKKDKVGVVLPAIGKTKGGKLIVLGIITEDQTEIPDEIDAIVSCKLTKEILGEAPTNNLIDIRLHTTGVGKEPFGKNTSKNPTEIGRKFGTVGDFDKKEALRKLNEFPKYQVKVSPFPDSSYLYFTTQNYQDLKIIKEIIDEENIKKYTKKEKNKTEDNIQKEGKIANIFPPISEEICSTIFLCAEEEGNKTKIITNEIFPQVPVEYWRKINDIAREYRWESIIHNYEKGALTGANSSLNPPSTYKLWTLLLTNLLHRRPTIFEPFWRILPRYFANHRAEGNNTDSGLNSPYISNKYLEILKIICIANNLVELEKTGELYEIEDKTILQEKIKNIKTMNEETIKKAVGKLWDFLPEARGENKEGVEKTQSYKELVFSVLSEIQEGIPTTEFPKYAKGFVTGVFLKISKNKLYGRGREIKLGNGTNPTKLRGIILTKEFARLEALGQGVSKSFSPFPDNSLHLLQAMHKISLTQSFNNGLIAGMNSYAK